MRTFIGTDKLYKGEDKIKRGETVMVLHDNSVRELGVGNIVHLPKDAERDFNFVTIDFELAGYRTVYDYDNRNSGKTGLLSNSPREALISHSSRRMNAEEAEVFSKMLDAAVKYVKKHKVTKKMIEEKRAYEAAHEIARQERELEETAARERRRLFWSNRDDVWTEANGLFTVVRNNNPEYRQASFKWLLRGPQYASRGLFPKDKSGKYSEHARKFDDCWDEYKVEKAFKTAKEAMDAAQRLSEEMISGVYPKHYSGRWDKIPLLKEIDGNGRLVRTDEMRRRMRTSPLQFRDNTKSEKVKA